MHTVESAEAPHRRQHSPHSLEIASAGSVEAVGAASSEQEPGVHEESSRQGARRAGLPVVFPLALMFVVAVNLLGAPYYLLPIQQRVRHSYHFWFRPSGPIGQGAGVAAFLLFLFLWLYPLRKRVRWMAVTGSVPRWLDYHIAAGLMIPLLGATHAAWRFQGLIGLGYGAMFVVCLSGAVGKYVYVRIPRSRAGVDLSLEQAEANRRRLLADLAESTGLSAETLSGLLGPERPRSGRTSILGALARMIRDDRERSQAIRALKKRWREDHAGSRADRRLLRRSLRLARREMALTQQIHMLDATQRVFKFWHAAHLPVAITALLAVTIHVVVVVALGATWFW